MLASQVRSIWRVAELFGLRPHLGQLTETVAVSSSTATVAAERQSRHQRWPVSSMTCMGDAMHW